jgi:hypothetical protein
VEESPITKKKDEPHANSIPKLANELEKLSNTAPSENDYRRPFRKSGAFLDSTDNGMVFPINLENQKENSFRDHYGISS